MWGCIVPSGAWGDGRSSLIPGLPYEAALIGGGDKLPGDPVPARGRQGEVTFSGFLRGCKN